jgi:protein involved in polysaccharide export with SLBB domain
MIESKGLAALLLALALLPGAAAAAVDLPTDLPDEWSEVAEYRIVPGDHLRLDFGFNPLEGRAEFNEQTVRPDGRITVFPVGDIVAAGRTAAQLDSAVTQALRSELRQPRVTVTVLRPAANLIHVLGRVEKPGSYSVDGLVTTVRAITSAGGFKDDAARNSVVVFRREGPNDVKVARVPVDKLLKTARIDQDLRLSPYDIVYVPRSSIGNVNVFARQFFGEQGQALSTILLGWQLFNLDRVFVVASP